MAAGSELRFHSLPPLQPIHPARDTCCEPRPPIAAPGRTSIEISSGELHRQVGGYPGPDHSMPVCCTAMRDGFDAAQGDVSVAEPPSGKGASLRILFRVPRPV